MTEIITYRLSGTGIWVYEFYDAGRNKIGSVGSEIAPSSPTRIDGGGVSWYSRYNLDQTIVPGTGRQVKDSSTGSEVYRVIYWQTVGSGGGPGWKVSVRSAGRTGDGDDVPD